MLSIKDGKERDYYFKQASTAGWSRDSLRKAIEKDLFTVSRERKKLPPGTPTLERPDNPLHVYKAIVEKVVDGDTLLVRVDLGFDVWVNQRTRFRGINTAEIIRNGIPAGDTPDRAEQAKLFVEEKLKGIDFVVLKSYKTDIYGRYVVDSVPRMH
jgi:endonuclease YncB( thermonuclease family)